MSDIWSRHKLVHYLWIFISHVRQNGIENEEEDDDDEEKKKSACMWMVEQNCQSVSGVVYARLLRVADKKVSCFGVAHTHTMNSSRGKKGDQYDELSSALVR